ncbi:hypothetical protein XENOCAPTIV_017281 [Xenoophorus captivus]|uniref:Uncharacterized protein n=1 Tax=Xenoophorus captivus TaxID=1517983 RepID=A0ABV0RAV6_9TELE
MFALSCDHPVANAAVYTVCVCEEETMTQFSHWCCQACPCKRWPFAELSIIWSFSSAVLRLSNHASFYLLPIESLCVQTYSAGGMLNLFPAAQHQTSMLFFKLGFN